MDMAGNHDFRMIKCAHSQSESLRRFEEKNGDLLQDRHVNVRAGEGRASHRLG